MSADLEVGILGCVSRMALGGYAALTCVAASGQVAPVVPPQVTPGVLQEQLRRLAPQPPAEVQVPATPPALPTPLPAGVEGVQVQVRTIELTGNSAIPTAELEPTWRDLLERELPLAEVYKLADTLTSTYRNRGYVLSAVLVPPQTIRDGVVRLQVVEGYVGRVQFEPEAAATPRMRAEAEAIAREKPLTIGTLERQMLLLNELGGVTAQAYFEPGSAPGEALLTIKASRRTVTGFVGIQNRVSRQLGDVVAEGRVTLNNPLGLDDSHSLLLQTTNRARLKSIGYQYTQPIGSSGLAMNLFLGHIESRVDVSGGNVESKSDIATLGFTYPLIRSRNQTLRLRARLNYYNGKQDLLSGLLVQEDHARALRLGAAWDRTDAWGVNFADVEVSKGLRGVGATRNGASEAQRADADYGFTKINVFAGRLQRLGGNFSLQASVQGQWANHPLPPSERAALGGELILRAFNAGDLIGDRVWAGKLELRYEPPWIEGGRIALYGFAEAGRATTLQTALPDVVQKGGTTGVGVRGSLASGANFYAEVAVPHRRTPSTSNSRRARFFAGLSYEF